MDEIFNQLKCIKYPANIPQGERLGIPYDDIELERKNKDKLARWKGAGLGEYYCSLCCEVGDIRSLRCPKCNARMYTNEEYNEKAKEWEAEDEAERAFWSLEGIV